jgi:quinolinate synthase
MADTRPFPSLIVSRDGVQARGSFAEAQAAFLEPDARSIGELRSAAAAHGVGIVAHFYMDPELQGVLAASGYPHVHISDSLAMADSAVEMVRRGARRIVVLGVDFMAENVRAVLDHAGHADIPVYRVSRQAIGCSLAEAAESAEYLEWLKQAGTHGSNLHVIYINTSLYTKAHAHALVPTVTCTSSNVVKTVLAAFHQMPDLRLWFGPDTYMGQNLQVLFESLQHRDESEIRRLHPGHDRNSLTRVIAGFNHFRRGNCIVHHMFSEEVARRVKAHYSDAFITAHLEVPGAMFALGLEAQRSGRGVVGSTSDILGFVRNRVEAARQSRNDEPLRFVLGTETGMVTSLVRTIQTILRGRSSPDMQDRDTQAGEMQIEIVFPVAAEAVTSTGEASLPIVPGPAGGEGCSAEGGCATCPYMKMNSLDALMELLARLGGDSGELAGYMPRMRQGTINGRALVDWAVEPITHMREFSKQGQLPAALIDDVRQRSRA